MKTYSEPKYDILWQVVYIRRYKQRYYRIVDTSRTPALIPGDFHFIYADYVIFTGKTKSEAMEFLLEYKLSHELTDDDSFTIQQVKIKQHKYKRGY